MADPIPIRRDQGRFPPGASGNAGGRPKLDPEVRELLSAPNTVARVKRLEELSAKAEAAGDLRTAAHIELALLKKTLPDLSAMELTGDDGAPLSGPTPIDLKRCSPDELRFLQELMRRQHEGA